MDALTRIVDPEIKQADLVETIHDQPVEQAAARATVLEIGLVPADPSPDAD
jgi:hypothetical protein